MFTVNTRNMPDNWRDNVYRHDNPYHPFDGIGDISLSDLSHVDRDYRANDLYISPLCEYGDYCGSTVELSNFRVFWSDFKDHPYCYRVYGGHGNNGVAVELRVFNDPSIAEWFAQLDDYCVADEDDLSEVETELTMDYLHDIAYRPSQFDDVSRAIRDVLGLENGSNDVDSPYIDLWVEVMSPLSRLYALQDAWHDSVIEPEHEDTGWPYVRWESFAREFIARCNARAADLRHKCNDRGFALLTSHHNGPQWELCIERLSNAYRLYWRIETIANSVGV